MKKHYLIRFAVICFACSQFTCSKKTSGTGGNPPPPTNGPAVDVWQTNGDKSNLLVKITTKNFVTPASTIPTLQEVEINTTQTYQPIDGFGAALTGSSAYVINRYLSPASRTQLLQDLFTKNGIGIDYIRLTIGASDFSLSDFSYDDTAGDTLMTAFSIGAENADLLPVLKEIIAINPNIKIMASPWSPPAWMKTNNSMKGGSLQPEYYHAYARYFVKYIQAMKTEGINIDAITIQNEPLYGAATYPCMYMFATEQRDFIKDHLGPMFAQNAITTKIMLYDHNWDKPLYGDTILQNATAKQYVAGTAFHAYGGSVDAMTTLHNLHPDKDLFFTEISGGGWAPNFSDNIKWFTENIIIGTTRNWSRNALLWNMALDQNDGPKNNGCSNCRGVVTVNANGAIIRNEEYYVLGQAGKFTKQGAQRCSSSDISAQGIKNVAFLNTDGSKVLIAMNTTAALKSFRIKDGNNTLNYDLQPNAIYTFYWNK